MLCDEAISDEEAPGSESHRCGGGGGGAPNSSGGYDPASADVWSLGVTLFTMVAGHHPWDEATDNDSSFRRLKRGASVFRTYSSIFPPHLSLPLRDLLQSMLAFDKEERVGMEEIASHPWVLAAAGVSARGEAVRRPLVAQPVSPNSSAASSVASSAASSCNTSPIVTPRDAYPASSSAPKPIITCNTSADSLTSMAMAPLSISLEALMVPSLAGTAPTSWTGTPKAKPEAEAEAATNSSAMAMETSEARARARVRAATRRKRHTADSGTMAAAAAAARAAVHSRAHAAADPTTPAPAPATATATARPLTAHRKRPSDNDFSFMTDEEIPMPSQPKRPRPQPPLAGPDVRRRRAHSF